MATLTRRALRLVAVVGAVPAAGIAVGYRIRALQAEENVSAARRVYKVSDLPIYSTSGSEKSAADESVSQKNVVEEQISEARKAVQNFLGQFEDTYEKVKTTVDTGIEHTMASLDMIQNSPRDLPRVSFIAVAGIGGALLGFRGGILRKLAYGSLASASCAALCYPTKTVEISQLSVDFVKEQWKENSSKELLEKYWPFRKDEQSEAQQTTPAPESPNDHKPESKEKRPRLKGDLGQSNPADKDLYSTRSS